MNDCGNLLYQVSIISDKKIAIKFDTYDSAKHFLSFSGPPSYEWI